MAAYSSCFQETKKEDAKIIFVDTPRSIDPSRTNFGFIIHPRVIQDITNNYSFPPEMKESEIGALANNEGPKLLGLINNSGGFGGAYVASLFDPIMFERDIKFCRKKIKEAAAYAREKGLVYAGLGGLSAALSRYGKDLEEIEGLKVTTGHALTPWTLDRLTQEAISELEFKNPHLGILGAAGSVGMLLAKRFSRTGYPLTLIDLESKKKEVEKLSELCPGSLYSKDLASAEEVNILITVTNGSRQIIDIDEVKPGMILIDDAQPWCWDHFKAYERFKQNQDIFPLEGGFLTSYSRNICQTDIDTMNQRDKDFFCCLGEVLLLANSDQLSPVIGKNDLQNLNQRLELSNKYGNQAELNGILPAPFQCGKHVYSPEEIESFKRKL